MTGVGTPSVRCLDSHEGSSIYISRLLRFSMSTKPEIGVKVNDSVYRLYPDGNEAGVPNVEIVFLHGVTHMEQQQSYLTTWMTPDGSLCWPKAWLPTLFSGAAIYLVSYDSCAITDSTHGRSDPFLVGESVLNNMQLAKIGQNDGCPLILVGHDLGGLIIKQICWHAHRWNADIFLKNLRGVFFIATPHGGLHLNIAPNGETSRIYKSMGVLDTQTSRLNEDFHRLKKLYLWKTYNVQASHGPKPNQLNWSNEAAMRLEGGPLLMIPTNSDDITKPKDETSGCFPSLQSFIESILSDCAAYVERALPSSPYVPIRDRARIRRNILQAKKVLSPYEEQEPVQCAPSLSTDDRLERFAEQFTNWQYSLSEIVSECAYEFFGIEIYTNNFVCQSPRHSSQKKRVLSTVLRILGKLPVKRIRFDDVHSDFLVVLPSEEWNSFFTSLLSSPYLQAVSIDCTGALCSTVCTHIRAFLANTDTLKTLEVGSAYTPGRRSMLPLTETAIQALSDGLMQTRNLKNLRVFRGDKEWADVLTRAFLGESQNRSLELVELTPSMEELERALPVLLNSGYQSLKEIRILISSEYSEWQETDTFYDHNLQNIICGLTVMMVNHKGFRLGKSLRTVQQTTCTVKKRTVVLVVSIGSDEEVHCNCSHWLDKIVEGSEGAPTLEIEVNFTLQRFTIKEDHISYGHREKWILLALNRYSQLTRVYFHCRGVLLRIDRLMGIFETIKSNESLRSVGFADARNDTESEACWTYLFEKCLRHKTNLKKLSFRGCRNMGDECFRSLMGLLQVNIYLDDIDLQGTPWEDDGKAVLVREALRRNKTQAAYFSTLGNAKLRFHDAKAGRLFLCGNPLAGKTRLRITMINTQRKTSRMEKQLLKIPFLVPLLKRTTGVDVEMLKDDDEMQVSVWDLAGQQIFRALQDLILPKINQACVFLFVFSPVQDNQIEIKDEVDMAFQDELKSWLRFVASNCQITGSCLPQVLVVITHKDWMEEHNASCEWAKKIVNHYREIFRHALDLHAGLHYINAQNVEEVQSLTDHILHLFADFLHHKTPSVPWVCSQLISQVSKHPEEMINRPVWLIDDFYGYVSETLEALKAGAFKPHIEGQRKVLEAVVLYMHDVGSVFASKSGLIVVDINWLTHKFLGKLISDGHSFQVSERILYKSSDGFMGKPVLDRILSNLSREYEQEGVKINSELLEQLLEDLGLCYLASSENGVARYFIPTIFGIKGNLHEGVALQTAISWNTGESSDWRHFGYRLLCEKPDTSLLTSSVFPRFQIHLRNETKLMSPELGDKNIGCARDLIRLRSNGCFVIVENDGFTGDHIDVLVRYSILKPREEAIAFVKENIITKFREFCALPEGCPGVTLVMAIMRPECVKRLTPHQHRVQQVVLVESLKSRLMEGVVEKLHRDDINWQSDDEGSLEHLLSYEHMWPDVPEADLPELPQPAVVLLEKKDLEEILKAVQELQNQWLEELDMVEKELDESLRQWSDQDSASNAGYQRQIERPDDDCSVALCSQKTGGWNAALLPTHSDHMMEMKATFLQCLEDVRSELKDVFRLRQDVRSTLLSIMSKVDDMIGYTDALEKASIPRYPFFTVEDELRDKVSGVMEVGAFVRLHLRCESRLEPHVVEDQPGLRLYVAHENKELLHHISVSSMAVVWYLIKAGVHSMSGTRQFLPEFSELSPLSNGGLVTTNMALEEFKNLNSMPVEERRRITEKAWIFLNQCLLSDFDFLATFRLHLVEYFAGTVAVNESYAWMCKNCITEGKKNGVLREV